MRKWRIHIDKREPVMDKIKILLITNTIMHYRVPVYNALNEIYDVTIIYSFGDLPDDIKFKVINIGTINILKLRMHQCKLWKIADQYEVTICLNSLNWISIMMLPFLNIKSKVILWGMGVLGSTSHRYDYSNKFLFFQKLVIKKSDASIFYSEYPKWKYSNLGIDERKMFVAPNTVQIQPQTIQNRLKQHILFIGTLYKNKNLSVLIEEYSKAVKINPEIPKLVIVGDGEERIFLENLVKAKNLQSNIVFLGSITEENRVAKLFLNAIICVSLGQAGLSVQKSMGYGVPFITRFNAYTGGERFDIHNGVDGLLLKDDSELCDVFIDLVANREKYLQMGRNAYDFYWNNRTIDHMIKGFVDAIDFVLSK